MLTIANTHPESGTANDAGQLAPQRWLSLPDERQDVKQHSVTTRHLPAFVRPPRSSSRALTARR